jgi:PEGA domain
MKKPCAIVLLIALFAAIGSAKNEPAITISWPSDKPALKLNFEKFRQMSAYGGQSVFVSDVTVQNLTDKQIPRASFNVYFMDKNKVRIGEGLLQVSDLEAGQSAKIQLQFNSVGIPANLTLSAKKDMLAPPGVKTIPLKVVSVPPGAKLKVDGQDAGMTPAIVRFTVGTHQLDLIKEGYAPGSTPLEVTTDELPGGSVTVELGGLSRDTVELRDGTVLLGDVLSMSLTQVVVRVEGKDQSLDRNQVRKLMLVERVITEQPAITRPGSSPHQ